VLLVVHGNDDVDSGHAGHPTGARAARGRSCGCRLVEARAAEGGSKTPCGPAANPLDSGCLNFGGGLLGGIVAEKLFAWDIRPDGKPIPAVSIWPALEAHLEDWIENDVSIVDPAGLLYLGRQIPTDLGTTLDVLAMDAGGNLVIIELKRERSPREMIAQALEYAAWAETLTEEEILVRGASIYGSVDQFRAKFEERFKTDFPDADEMNREQRILLVAPEFSETVLRVARYLVTRFGVPLTAISFGLYQAGESRLLVRSAVVQEPIDPPDTGSKRPGRRTLQELCDLADERGTRDVVDELLRLREGLLTSVETTQTTINLRRNAGKGQYLSGISIHPGVEGQPGALINVSAANLSALLGLDVRELTNRWPAPKVNPWGSGWKGWHQMAILTREQAAELVALYRDAARHVEVDLADGEQAPTP